MNGSLARDLFYSWCELKQCLSKIEYYEKVLDRPSTLVVKSNDFNKKIETIKSKPTNTKT